ncbi:MAG: gliding motility protein GldL [Crocinitomicaceae bacterium]|jgi:gliding motility-associated protein GldL
MKIFGMVPGSHKWKMFMKYFYGYGAAVVVLGALFKIMHWPGASIMLVTGLLVEVAIFVMSSFEPLPHEYHWDLVYPELAQVHDIGHGEEDHAHEEESHEESLINTNSEGSITQHLDKMLEEAKIDSELLESLASGMRSLGENASSLQGISSAVAATDNYVSSLQTASDKISTLSDAYERASLTLTGLTSSSEEGESFGEQMQKVSRNLAALNNVYELQLKGSSAHLETTEKFQGQVTEMMKNLSDSVEDTRLYKENMATLTRNLSDLNQVYGNMLKAMTITRD